VGLTLVQETEMLSYVALSGRLDAPGVETLEKLFLAHTATRGKPALVDMSKVTFIASMGIRMLISCAQSLHHAGMKIILIQPQPLVKNALDMTGITALIPIVPDFKQAMALLANK